MATALILGILYVPAAVFLFIKTRKKKEIKPGSMADLAKNIPEDIGAAYLIGYVPGKGFRIFQLPYEQRKNV